MFIIKCSKSLTNFNRTFLLQKTGIYGFVYLPLDSTSFDINTNSTQHLENVSAIQYFPIVAFNILQFLGNFGVSAIPNMMMCEVFPFKLVDTFEYHLIFENDLNEHFFFIFIRSKAFATGIVATIYYFSIFFASKTYYMLEVLLTLPGLSILYACMGVVG